MDGCSSSSRIFQKFSLAQSHELVIKVFCFICDVRLCFRMDAITFYGRRIKDGKSDDSPGKNPRTLSEKSPSKRKNSPEESEKKAAKLKKIQFSILAPSSRWIYWFKAYSKLDSNCLFLHIEYLPVPQSTFSAQFSKLFRYKLYCQFELQIVLLIPYLLSYGSYLFMAIFSREEK